MHTILVPVDGSDHALKALVVATDLAEKYGGQIALLHVLAEGKRPSALLGLGALAKLPPKLKAELQHAAEKPDMAIPENVFRAVGEKILDQAASKVRRRGLEPHVLTMETGDPFWGHKSAFAVRSSLWAVAE